MTIQRFTPLREGSRIAVVAPTGGGDLLSPETIDIARRTLGTLGLECVFFPTTFTPIERSFEDKQKRATDINDAFSDPDIHAVLTVLGGYCSVHILDFLDYDRIGASKKLFCGFSDATALNSALLARCGLVSLSGPHFSTFGMAIGNEYTLSAFQRVAFQNHDSVFFSPSTAWSNDLWFLDQENRTFFPNQGPVVLQEGFAKGMLLGGNLSTQTLLTGTSYFYRSDRDLILFVEDDQESHLDIFDRMLFNLTEAIGAQKIKAILIGRFENDSKVDIDDLRDIFSYRPYLQDIPIVANLDFGHTTPLLSLPYGGEASIVASQDTLTFSFL